MSRRIIFELMMSLRKKLFGSEKKLIFIDYQLNTILQLWQQICQLLALESLSSFLSLGQFAQGLATELTSAHLVPVLWLSFDAFQNGFQLVWGRACN